MKKGEKEIEMSGCKDWGSKSPPLSVLDKNKKETTTSERKDNSKTTQQ